MKCKLKGLYEKNPKAVKLGALASGSALLLVALLLAFHFFYEDPYIPAPQTDEFGRTVVRQTIDSDNPQDTDDPNEPTDPIGHQSGWSVVERNDRTLMVLDANGNEVENVTIEVGDDGLLTIFDAEGNILAKMPDEIIRYIAIDPSNPVIDVPVHTDASGNTVAPPTTGRGGTTATPPPYTGDTPTGGNPTGEPADPVRPDTITITLSNNGIKSDYEGSHVRINSRGDTVTIRRPGSYIITGTSNNVEIVVNTNRSDGTGRDGVVTLYLQNANITNPNGPAIRTARDGTSEVPNKGMELVIHSMAGTTNKLVDGRGPRPDDVLDGEVDTPENRNGAIFSRFPLFITGDGRLNLVGGYAHALHARDTLTITSANITVERTHALGLRSRYAMVITNSDITLNNIGTKGIRAAGDNHGRIAIVGSNIVINSKRDAIDSSNNLNITDSTIRATVDGGFGVGSPATGMSKRGLRAEGNINLTGGEITVNSVQGGVNASGDIVINRVKQLTITSGGNAIRGRPNVTIRNSKIDILACNHGLTAGLNNRPGMGILSLNSNTINIHARSASISLSNNPRLDIDVMPTFTTCNGCH
jgi:hypothetical protein